MREYTSIDYSETILHWLENSKTDALAKWETILAGGIKQQQRKKPLSIDSQKQPLPTFRAVHMQNARFCDMEFRLGAGYLYCHQVECIFNLSISSGLPSISLCGVIFSFLSHVIRDVLIDL